MIRDLLIPEIKKSFPDLPFLFSESSNPIATLQASFTGLGTLEICDDGDEATVYITEVTHGHFNPYNASLSEEQRNCEIVENVIDFLRALFADQVLLFRTPDRGMGGWTRLDLSPMLPKFDSGREYFLWSGPYDRHKIA